MTRTDIISACLNAKPFYSAIGDDVAKYYFKIEGHMVIAIHDRGSTSTIYEIQSLPRNLS